MMDLIYELRFWIAISASLAIGFVAGGEFTIWRISVWLRRDSACAEHCGSTMCFSGGCARKR